MKIFCFDIETIPNYELPEECLPVFDPSEVKLGNLKDEIKIAAKIAEERESFAAGLVKKMSVSASLCRVCTFVGILYETQAKTVLDKYSIQLGIGNTSDYDVVFEGWTAIKSACSNRTPLVTFNGIGFDLPVMKTQAIRLDVSIVNTATYKELTGKWGPTKLHYDLCKCLSDFDLSKMEKLNFWLRYYGIGQKTDGMDGSKVYEAYQAGGYEKIQKYCEDDVLGTCKLFARVEPWITI